MTTLLCLALLTQPTAIHIPRADATRYLAGECFPVAPRQAPDGVTLVLRQNTRDPLEIAHGLILALGAVPESRLIEVDEDIPDGFKDLGIFGHRGHHPHRKQRLVAAPIRPVTLCEGR